MKRVVVQSIEDVGGDRCVDILDMSGDGFAYVECRRDPEDSHGWRHLGVPVGGFGSHADAVDAARGSIAWMKAAV